MIGICLVLLDMENRIPGPFQEGSSFQEWMGVALWRIITEMNRICLVLFDMNNMIFGPYLGAMDRILISGMHARSTAICCCSSCRWV
jgi:hypothetical protein